MPRKHGPGRRRVTVRPHYGGPPTRAGRGTGRARRKPRDRAGEEPPSGPGSTVPRPKIAAVERRKATRSPLRRARRPKPERAEADEAANGGAFRRSASLDGGRHGGKPERTIRRHPPGHDNPCLQHKVRSDTMQDAKTLVLSLFLMYGAAVIPPGSP